MESLKKARLYSLIGNLVFFACMLLAVLAGAFAATATDNTTLTLSLCLGGAALVLGGVFVYLFRRVAGKHLALAREEEAAIEAAAEAEAEANAAAPGEDGLPTGFCREIRAYSLPQLRLIAEEQKDEYSEKEMAFILKVIAERE
ncbi:MAG: hypothetical protein IJV96_01330 [Clostridia bacterium]|nr:hypothetical protein [Clostridia bacterium]